MAAARETVRRRRFEALGKGEATVRGTQQGRREAAKTLEEHGLPFGGGERGGEPKTLAAREKRGMDGMGWRRGSARRV